MRWSCKKPNETGQWEEIFCTGTAITRVYALFVTKDVVIMWSIYRQQLKMAPYVSADTGSWSAFDFFSHLLRLKVCILTNLKHSFLLAPVYLSMMYWFYFIIIQLIQLLPVCSKHWLLCMYDLCILGSLCAVALPVQLCFYYFLFLYKAVVCNVDLNRMYLVHCSS